ncbi:DPY30 domain-containing protein 2-like [Trichosurus vulpecula]|uniref:DPY30 domain-containing protein 2-like n=1 Tax=Trichosurus vulpecula TaxID=9337 RepID=UPI00186B4716|nr:DPY30 domain-containing protein 2-like [Trichosurus vulpecula]
MSLETEYLKKCLGKCLVEGLAKLVEHRPSDPIEYLAYWIYEYRRQIHASHQRKLEKLQLSEERMESLLELEIAQKLKAEEIQFQKQHEEYKKKTMLDTYPEQRPHIWQEKFGTQKLPPLEEIDESLLSPNRENGMSKTDWKEELSPKSNAASKTGSQEESVSDAVNPT